MLWTWRRLIREINRISEASGGVRDVVLLSTPWNLRSRVVLTVPFLIAAAATDLGPVSPLAAFGLAAVAAAAIQVWIGPSYFALGRTANELVMVKSKPRLLSMKPVAVVQRWDPPPRVQVKRGVLTDEVTIGGRTLHCDWLSRRRLPALIEEPR